MSLRNSLRSVHKGLGLALLILFTVQSLSGIALVYRDEVEGMLTDAYPVHSTGEARYDVDTYLQALSSRYPDYRVARIEYSPRATRPLVVYLAARAGRAQRIVLLDPYAGDVVGELEGLALLPFWLFKFHKELTLGYPGEVVIAAEGLGLLVLLISGMALWWPTRKSLRRQFSLRGARGLIKLNLHRLTGLLGFPFLLPVIIAGTVVAIRIVWSGPSGESPLTNVVAGAPVTPVVREQIASRETPIRDIRLSPDQAILSLNFESADVVRPLATDRVQISRESGEVMKTQRAADLGGFAEIYAWMYPLHSGKFAGAVGKATATVAGWTLLMLTILGLSLYLERRKLGVTRRTA